MADHHLDDLHRPEPAHVGYGATNTALDLFALGGDIEIVDPQRGEVSFVHETNRGGGQAVAAGGHIVIYNQDGITG